MPQNAFGQWIGEPLENASEGQYPPLILMSYLDKVFVSRKSEIAILMIFLRFIAV